MNNNQIEEYSLKENIMKCYKTWCIYSQIHGLSFMTRAKRFINRLVWISGFLLCFGLCLNALIRIARDFFDYGVVASIKIGNTFW